MQYTLSWLDYAVALLNPARHDFVQPGERDSEVIAVEARQEVDKQKAVLKNLVFSFSEKRKIRVLIRYYHKCLVLLLDKAYENQVLGKGSPEAFHSCCRAVISAITQLLGFIEEQFSDLIGAKGLVPAAYLVSTIRDLHHRTEICEKKLVAGVATRELARIVLHALYGFTSRYQDLKVTLRDVLYKKELVREMEKVLAEKNKAKLHDQLVEKLIYLNFNSRAFINYYTGRVAREVRARQSVQEKLDCLLLHFKEFNQMHLKPEVGLNPHYDRIAVVIGRWFTEEIRYQKSRAAGFEGLVKVPEDEQVKSKAKVGLTVDQMAVAVRALVDTKILEVKSVSQAFRLLVPYLSTQQRKDISWASARRKAYEVEDSDKKVVVAMLEKAIGMVKSY